MKAVTYNIRYALGLDGVYDYDRIADAVRGADIIALQEVERHWRRSDMADQVALIAERLPDYYWSFFPAFDVDASALEENAPFLNRRRQFGPMLLSRYKILETRVHSLPKIASPFTLNMDTGALEGVVDTPTGPLRVYSLHLSATSQREKMLQLDHLIEVFRAADRHGGSWTGSGPINDPGEMKNYLKMDWSSGDDVPTVPKNTLLMGDFNMTPESPEYCRLVGEEDLATGRRLHCDGFADSWSFAQEKVDSEELTWWPDPPERSPGVPLRLDYCFVSPGLAYHVKRAWVDVEADGSDHRPYWVEFSV